MGTREESVDAGILQKIVQEFLTERDRQFGSHVVTLEWALHNDESTPHIRERHVFQCRNKYGEMCLQQEKALEKLGIPLPNPDKPKGRNNNRKMTFDAMCILMFIGLYSGTLAGPSCLDKIYLEDIEGNWTSFVDTYFGEYYDFSR